MDKTKIDLNDNLILKSENIEYNNDNLKNFLDSKVIAHDTNDNGSYIRFSDGTLFCMKKVSGSVDITSKWGNLYDTGNTPFDLGAWPYVFIELPETVQITFVGGNGQWLEGYSIGYSKEHAGKITIASATSKNANVNYQVLAIGKWK